MGPRDLSEEERVRVKIKIEQPELYPEGAAEALSGLTGVTVRHNPKSFYGSTSSAPLEQAYLVELDKPIPVWWASKGKVRAFWVSKRDLRKVK